MLSHDIKQILERATPGIEYSPINAVMPTPCGSYTLREIQRSKALNKTQCDVRVFCKSYDELEIYREKIVESLNTQSTGQDIVGDKHYIRATLSGGGILEEATGAWYELSLIFILTWKEKN